MKNFRKVLIAIFCVMLLVCMGLFAAACDSDNDSGTTPTENGGSSGGESSDGGSGGPSDETPVTYTVTVNCGDGGSYTLSHQNPIAENTEVTLTVTPDVGYVVSSAKVNGSTVSLVENKYTFTLTENTTVTLSFKTAKYTVSVECGTNGTYSISNIGSVKAGTEITLTVTPYSGYMLDSVTINGTAMELTGNVLTFTLTEDAAIVISFKVEAYDVNVTCDEHGSYTLSHENPVAPNTTVTLTVTPNDDYGVDKVLADGVETPLTEGKCTFTVTKETNVTITFKLLPGIFDEACVGLWTPNVGAGTMGSSINVHVGNVIFNDVARDVTVDEGTYSFSVVDAEGTTFNYSFTFQEIYGGKNLLVMSYRDPNASEATTIYYLKDGVDYFTYEAVEGSLWQKAVGSWYSVTEGVNIPLEITASGLMLGTGRGIVLAEETAHTPSQILVESTVYTISVHEIGGDVSLITVKEGDETISFNRAAVVLPTLIPQHKGTYTSEDEKLTIVIDDDGNLYFNGTLCEVRRGDAAGTMETYNFTCDGIIYDFDCLKRRSNTTNYLWLRQENIVQDEGVYLYGEDYPFNMSYTVTVNCGEHGKAVLTATTEPNDAGYYASGTVLTFTITADPGYMIQYCYFNARNIEDHTNEAKNKTEFVLTLTLSDQFYDWYGTASVRFYVTFVADPTAITETTTTETATDVENTESALPSRGKSGENA